MATKPLPPWATYPAPNIGKYQRLVNPSSLPPEQKQALWRGIKNKNPALADMMVNDGNMATLKEVFSASVVFTAEEINGFIEGDPT